MKNKLLKISVCICFVSLILFSSFNTTFAAINQTYGGSNEVEESDLDTKVKNSVVLDALASLVYAVGSLTEWLFGKAFQGITGVNYYPWADKVIFNCIPMLDVNIFNPSPASLFKTRANDEGKTEITPLATIVRNTYFTILTITIAFLTIVVAIIAIKLAISTIASDKAKYKEAISNWLFAILLIFLMHNLISFVLWTNEKMVEVASSILKKQLDNGSLALIYEESSMDAKQMIDLFIKCNSRIS